MISELFLTKAHKAVNALVLVYLSNLIKPPLPLFHPLCNTGQTILTLGPLHMLFSIPGKHLTLLFHNWVFIICVPVQMSPLTGAIPDYAI